MEGKRQRGAERMERKGEKRQMNADALRGRKMSCESSWRLQYLEVIHQRRDEWGRGGTKGAERIVFPHNLQNRSIFKWLFSYLYGYQRHNYPLKDILQCLQLLFKMSITDENYTRQSFWHEAESTVLAAVPYRAIPRWMGMQITK